MSDVTNEAVNAAPLEPEIKRFDRRIIAEIAIVLGTMLGVKYFADKAELIGAGGIAIWCAIIVATIFMRQRSGSWRALGLTWPKTRREWLVTVGLSFAALLAAMLMMVFAVLVVGEAFGLSRPEEAPDRFAFFLGRPGVFLGYLLVVVWIGAALGEELLMRGFLMNRIADFFGHGAIGWTIALVGHAVFFGSLHLYQGLLGMIGAGAIALAFGLIYLVSKRRLLPLVIGHGLMNTMSLTGYYLTDGAMT